ncbi:MAG: glycosyl hydrolase family 8 [Planctomycetota bacterium]
MLNSSLKNRTASSRRTRRSAHKNRRQLELQMLESRQLLAGLVSTWAAISVPGSGGRIDAISVKPGESQSVLVSGDMLGVGYSRDGGQSWQGNFEGQANYQAGDFTWDPNSVDRVWVGTHGGPHVSDDGGESWALSRAGMPETLRNRVTAPIEKVLFDPNDPEQDRLLAFEGDHRRFDSSEGQYNGKVWISESDGERWESSFTVVEGGNITDAEYLGDSGQYLFATVYGEGVYLSEDDGQTWDNLSNGLPSAFKLLGVVAHPTEDTQAWVLDEDGGVYFTEDRGQNWVARTNGLLDGPAPIRFKSMELAEMRDGQATLYVGSAPNGAGGDGVHKSIDGGENWDLKLTGRANIENGEVFAEGANTWWIEVDPNDPETVWAGGSARIMRSTDGGDTWIDMLNDPGEVDGTYTGRGFMGWIGTNYEVNPEDPNHVIAQAWDSGRLIQSRDGGASWTRVIEQTEFAFPSVGYEFGLTPENADPQDAVEAWRAWKEIYVTDIGVPDAETMLRVSHEPNGAGRSSDEFQGYGMLFAAYLEPNDTVLRQLWNYAEHHLNFEGLMPWNISPTGVVEGPSSALDGDVDIAMALEVAEQRWPGRGWGELATTYLENTI